MISREQAVGVFVDALSEIMKKPKEEFISLLDADLRKDLGMTSIEFYPLIAKVEDEVDVVFDYGDFILNVHTVDQGADYILALIDGQ